MNKVVYKLNACQLMTRKKEKKKALMATESLVFLQQAVHPEVIRLASDCWYDVLCPLPGRRFSCTGGRFREGG